MNQVITIKPLELAPSEIRSKFEQEIYDFVVEVPKGCIKKWTDTNKFTFVDTFWATGLLFAPLVYKWHNFGDRAVGLIAVVK